MAIWIFVAIDYSYAFFFLFYFRFLLNIFLVLEQLIWIFCPLK
jgi:hypothetical protein